MTIKAFENKIWLASPYMHEEEQKYVKDAFDKNWITTAGENINELEKAICEYTGVKYAVALASGTSAIHLALIDAGVKAGDKVFSTDMTFAATCNPIKYLGAEPIFIDEEPDTWNMDPKALAKAFEKYPDVKVVVVANLYGVPAKLDEIKEICQSHNAILIEDAAESLGAVYKGGQTGSWGDYGAISFNGNKIITGSTGGMILTDNKESADHMRKLSTQAREPFPYYQHEEIGYNFRMSNIVAGVARGQFEHLEEHIAGKKAIYDRYAEGFKDLPVEMHGGGNYWLSCLKIDDEIAYNNDGLNVGPEDIIAKLAEYNAEARHIWKPMSMQPVYENCAVVELKEMVNIGEWIFNTGLCLPSDLNMTAEEQDIVIEIVRGCFR